MCSEELCLLAWDKSCDVVCNLGCNLCLCRYKWCPCYECCNEDEEEEEQLKKSSSNNHSDEKNSHHDHHGENCNCKEHKKAMLPTLSEEEKEMKRLKRKEKNMHYNRKLETGVYILIIFGFLYMGVMPLVVSYYWIDLFGLFVDPKIAPNIKYPLLELKTTYSTQDWNNLNLLGAHWSLFLYYIGLIVSYVSYEVSKRSNPGRIFVEGDEKRLGYVHRTDSITFEKKEQQESAESTSNETNSSDSATLRNRKNNSQTDTEEKKDDNSKDDKKPLQEFPTRSKYCTRCGHRSAKYDHHCLWISNCVGEKNQFKFLVFLLAMVIQMSICLFLVIYLFYLCYNEVTQIFDFAFEFESMKRTSALHGKRIEELFTDRKTYQMIHFLQSNHNNPIMPISTFIFVVLNFINLAIAGLVFAFVGFMTGVQTYMISFNMASVEYFDPEKYTYKPKIQLNWRRNWMLFYKQMVMPWNKFVNYDKQ